MDKEPTVCTKIGADKSAKNIPNAPKCICPKVFDEKRHHWASVVCEKSLNPRASKE